MSVRTRPSRLILHSIGALAMAVNRTARYITSFENFLTLIDAGIKSTLDNAEQVQVFQQQGRVFDRVVLRRSPKTPLETLFHVRIDDGAVFGPKSNTAPNLRLWYGSIYSAREWDFTNPMIPVPKNPDRFKKVGQWGPYTHWVPKGMRKSLAERKTPLPSE